MNAFDLTGQEIAIGMMKMPRQNGFALDTQQLIAHKGGMWGVPLNSLYAYQKAFAYGLAIVECDVQVTSDSIPVNTHDQTINKYARNPDGTTISSDIYVYNHTYQELNQYEYGIQYGQQFAGLKLLKIDDLLQYCRMYGLSLQVDTDSTRDSATHAQLIYETVKKRKMLDYVIFDCPNTTVAEAYATLDQNLNLLVQNIESTSAADSLCSQFGTRCKRLIAGSGVTWTPDKTLVDYVHMLGMGFKANLGDGNGGYVDFTPGSITPSDVKDLFEIGVDFYVSDNITPEQVLTAN